ncbi:hypothetical protein SAMN04515667_0162 [Formosa sp. Hel1_31_208]|nr:hypothetical protein SAMN04515667_0162 [Formosa sp. Hel1_31_208]
MQIAGFRRTLLNNRYEEKKRVVHRIYTLTVP